MINHTSYIDELEMTWHYDDIDDKTDAEHELDAIYARELDEQLSLDSLGMSYHDFM